MKTIFSYLLAIAFSFVLISCSDLNISDRIEAFPIPEIKGISFNNFNNSQSELSEVAPPILIRKLGQVIDNYTPQVSILEPLPDKVLDETRVSIKLKVTDFPLFKDENLEMGPHLHLILDNEPYQAIYSVDEPIVIENLEPGTHSLRVFAARPWHESFKNQGAFAETTFHILTKTQANNPDPQVPLLTYSRPNGTYGAEPIMLDFYLSHLSSKEIVKNSAVEGLPSWRVKATVNGESFILDQWQPVYLSGFKVGNNWIQLELLDDEGNSIENTFNNTVRLITYDPELEDSLARVVTGEIELQNAIAIVDPNYEIPLEETLQGVSKEALEENITTESEAIQEDNIPADNLEITGKKVNAEVEIINETPEVIKEEEIVEPEITQQDNIPADHSEVIEKKVKTEAEIVSETSEVDQEEIIEPEIPQQNNIPADKSEVIKEEVNSEIEIAPETSEVSQEKIVEPEITQQDNISTDNLERTEEKLNTEADIISEIPEAITEKVIASINVKELPEFNESDTVTKVVLANKKIVIEPEVPITLAKELTTSETIVNQETTEINESNSETESDQITDLVSIREEPFNITINLDQWVFDHLRQFKDKIIKLSKLFLE